MADRDMSPGPFVLSDVEKQLLHRAACRLIDDAVRRRPVRSQEKELGQLAEQPVVGVFVTLRQQGELRGCIGNFMEQIRLGEALERAAIGSATTDPRFPPVQPHELPQLTVELSLLHSRQLLPPSPEGRKNNIEVGKHGLDLIYAGRKGLLLPQVPVEWGWNVDQFLQAVCRKAGLPDDAWKEPDADLYRFEATYFGGPFDSASPH